MVTKVTNVPTFARSLPLSMVNPPLWILSTELHRFILTGIHIFPKENENNEKDKSKGELIIRTSFLSTLVHFCFIYAPKKVVNK